MADSQNTTTLDTPYQRRAIELAALGAGWVNPNPQVGAVIVKEGQVIGEGYHQRFGGLHAERNAIAAAEETLTTGAPRAGAPGAGAPTTKTSESKVIEGGAAMKGLLRGATMYVTLEPCCHTGKTPPCTDAIISAGISRVVIGSDDPNPAVAGQGIVRLREAGLDVVTNFLQEECDQLNQIFFHFIKTKKPYVLMKYAMTLDGKIATHTGASKWITGEEARADVHRLRGRYAAIMVGIGTVLADDPLLNCRLEGGHDPVRVICDPRLHIPLSTQIVQTASEQPTIIVATTSNSEKEAALKERGCEVLFMPAEVAEAEGTSLDSTRIDLRLLMKLLGERNLDSVLIEGGAALHGAALEAGIVQRVRCYVAPKLFGGKDAPSPIGGAGVETPEQALQLSNTNVEVFGDDYCIEGEVR